MIDRSNGKLISAEPYVPQNWAEKIDLVTGRPVEKPGVRYEKEALFHLSLGPRRACVDADELFAEDRAGLHPGDARADQHGRRRALRAASRALEHRHQDGRADPAGTCEGGRLRRLAGRVGPGEAESRVEGPSGFGLERRHAGDRRQPGVPGRRPLAVPRLRRPQRQGAVEASMPGAACWPGRSPTG